MATGGGLKPGTGRIGCEYLEAGVLSRRYALEAFAYLREAGCTVKWADERRGLLHTTWYNVEIEGPERPLREFLRWMEDVINS